MTPRDVANLAVGDSIIGFAGSSTEYPVEKVGPLNYQGGKATRMVTVRTGPRAWLRGLMVSGDDEQRRPPNANRNA